MKCGEVDAHYSNCTRIPERFRTIQRPPQSRRDAFTIEIESMVTPVSRAANRLARVKLTKLKKKLEDLIDKGFI